MGGEALSGLARRLQCCELSRDAFPFGLESVAGGVGEQGVHVARGWGSLGVSARPFLATVSEGRDAHVVSVVARRDGDRVAFDAGRTSQANLAAPGPVPTRAVPRPGCPHPTNTAASGGYECGD